jgi:hypothetical protein
MKKIFCVAMAVVAFASCGNEPETAPNDGEARVNITLTSEQAARAFFDDAATAEAWENEITSLTAYVFAPDGNLIARRAMTSAEVAAKSAGFSLPNSAAGSNCSFYVVANADYGNVMTVAAMDSHIENVGLADYNGSFGQTSQGRKRSAGFVMTGKTTAKIAVSAPTTVGVTLKRTVAKIAVKTTIDPSFAAQYGGGTVSINSVKISNVSAAAYSFAGSAYSRNALYEHSQTGDNGVFYVYENGALAAGNRVALTLSGTFDADGNAATTADRWNLEYKIELTGTGDGEIKRNGYYRLDVVIKGLAQSDLTVNFLVANWETPATQTVNIGA